MALFEFDVDDSFIGKTIGPPDGGFLVDNRQARPASSYITPYGNSNGIWVSGYFQIRGSLDQRDLICVNPSQAPASDGHVAARSIPYHGALRILCVPKGSLWRMTLSDVALTQRELYERGEAALRKAMKDDIAAIRAAKPPQAAQQR